MIKHKIMRLNKALLTTLFFVHFSALFAQKYDLQVITEVNLGHELGQFRALHVTR
jgi:hypothetical protein